MLFDFNWLTMEELKGDFGTALFTVPIHEVFHSWSFSNAKCLIQILQNSQYIYAHTFHFPSSICTLQLDLCFWNVSYNFSKSPAADGDSLPYSLSPSDQVISHTIFWVAQEHVSVFMLWHRLTERTEQTNKQTYIHTNEAIQKRMQIHPTNSLLSEWMSHTVEPLRQELVPGYILFFVFFVAVPVFFFCVFLFLMKGRQTGLDYFECSSPDSLGLCRHSILEKYRNNIINSKTL